ncbi:beta-1,3-galactosyltransferase 5 [Folsomia candida]|uniref:Hexosyltransferase n=1 Tax=Folsomia candida TaxID=158441 RepID=A0A226EUI9_FOLCA|nr:beta-1,3-galactosyltransferase 5 [Folsomia candida]OXA60286.1 hypothetical protein Fcan01_04844 [Folsomia candida]
MSTKRNSVLNLSSPFFALKHVIVFLSLIILNVWFYRILVDFHKTQEDDRTERHVTMLDIPNITTTLAPCLLRDLEILESMGSRDARLMLSPPVQVLLSPRTNGTDFKPLIVIMITSMAESILQRQEVRRTWMQWTKRFRVQALFFLGLDEDAPNFQDIYSDLVHEQQVYGDLVVIKFQEGYYRLTAKTLRMLEWFLQFYKGTEDRPKFLVKTDHDVFVNVPNLLRHMYSSETWTSMRQNGYYFGGHIIKKAGVNLNATTKWFVSPDYWYPARKFYPHFLSGPFYIMSSNILEKLFNGSFTVPLYPFEDVYLTGMLRQKVNLKLTQVDNLQLLSVPNMEELRNMIAGHSIFSLTSFQQYWVHFTH